MKAFLHYLVLVGIPLLGLLGILRIGEGLDAPTFVGGNWEIDPVAMQTWHPTCTPLDLPAGQLEMTILQSGRYVQVQFSDAAQTSMDGRLNGDTLMVRQALPSGADAGRICGARSTVMVQLQVWHPAGAPEQLVGQWVVPECEACLPQSFRAVRLVRQ